MSRRLSDILYESSQGLYRIHCPGCGHAHLINVDSPHYPKGPKWTFNNNFEKPTFHPSVKHYHPAHTQKDGTAVPARTICHYFVVDGNIQFCADSGHALAGQTVPLPNMQHVSREDI